MATRGFSDRMDLIGLQEIGAEAQVLMGVCPDVPPARRTSGFETRLGGPTIQEMWLCQGNNQEYQQNGG